MTDINFINTNNIVDWMYIELRTGSSASDATNIISRRAALLRNDGVILDTNGSTSINFGSLNPGEYYIAIFHRNHLPVLSSQTITVGP